MTVKEIINQEILFFKNQNNNFIIDCINTLVDEVYLQQNNVENLLKKMTSDEEISDSDFENIKSELDSKASEIEVYEQRWCELVLVLNERMRGKENEKY
jgi:hypothetical protein